MNSGGDGFLTRWSRRKVEAKQAEPTIAPASAPDESVVPASECAVDLDLLPSLEELTEATDITGFLKKGVPEALRNAALRKMWETDAAIRDYVGLAELQWDFNAAAPFAGYGELSLGADIAGMVREIADYHLKPAAKAELSRNEVAAAAPMPHSAALPEPEDHGPVDSTLAADLSEGAAETEDDGPAALPPRRRHGGATPR